MAYLFRLQSPMRVFEPVSPRAKLLGRTGEVLTTHEALKIIDVVVMSYDHRDKPAIKLAGDPPRFLLVEEIQEARELAHCWSHAHELDSEGQPKKVREQGRADMARIAGELAPMLRKYIRPDLKSVSARSHSSVPSMDSLGSELLPKLFT